MRASSRRTRRKAGNKRITIRDVRAELQRLRNRVEDLEDLRDLNAAIERNGAKPGVPWDQAKKELGL
ncbi:MAG: hypothetical protein DMG25_17245 [Acidobacteria bacterium]|nr:MAG: hypothetical protein DMG25_17245 [Acidobacteriota bacterium]PYV23750.1 MAG: hypothetical protein DMG27_14850 [Acidobacteriota bacterium]